MVAPHAGQQTAEWPCQGGAKRPQPDLREEPDKECKGRLLIPSPRRPGLVECDEDERHEDDSGDSRHVGARPEILSEVTPDQVLKDEGVGTEKPQSQGD